MTNSEIKVLEYIINQKGKVTQAVKIRDALPELAKATVSQALRELEKKDMVKKVQNENARYQKIQSVDENIDIAFVSFVSNNISDISEIVSDEIAEKDDSQEK